MRKIIFLYFIATITVLYSKALEIDDILTQKERLKLDIVLSYINLKRDSSLSVPIEYQTQNGDIVTIPTFVGEQQINQDYINYGFNIKYGLSSRFELFSILNLYTSKIYYSQASNFDSKSSKDFNSWVLGFNYQIKQETNTPALLIGVMANILERVKFSGDNGFNKSKNVSFKSYKLSTTTYYTTDPLVYLLNISYYINQNREFSNIKIDKSNQIIISPQLYFAINPYSSINFGVKYSHFGKSRLNSKIISNSGSDITYLFGSSYEINSKLVLNLTAQHSKQLNISKDSFSMGLSYSF